MKKYTRLTAIATTLIMLLSGCGEKNAGGPPQENMPTAQEQAVTAVKTELITLSSISEEYMYSGSIEPSDEVEVHSALSGEVATVNYDVGDTVQAGDVLFTMDTESIQKSVNVSEANVKSAQASVTTAENNLKMANGSSMQTQIENAKSSITSAETSIKNAETKIENAKVSLNTAQINLTQAEKDYNTNKALYEAGGVSEEAMNNYKDTYEQAKNTYTQAELTLQQANTEYQSAKDSLEQAQTTYDILVNQTSKENVIKAQDSLEQANAQLESSKAQLESSKQNLKDAVVTAPISGTISQCNVTAGANLSQGTVPFVIIGTNSVDVVVNVSEQLINSIKAGDSVRINVPTLSQENFHGTISSVSPDANQDGTYEVKVNIPNEDGTLKSGMFAQVYFTKNKSENAVVIPRDCVITKDNESYVFVTENGIAKKQLVETGIDNGDSIEITNGLTEGMTVVIEGQTYLSDGDAVNDVTNKSNTSDTEATSEVTTAKEG